MNNCNWENLADASVYFDWHHRRMIASMQIRNAFYRLAKNLSEEKQLARVIEVLNREEKTMSLKLLPVDYQSILLASLYSMRKQLGSRIKDWQNL
jgi:hypothetical protein